MLFDLIASFLTDYLLSAVLLFTGIFLTVKTGFIQIRGLGEGLKNTYSGLFHREKTKGISPFSALCTSLAAQLGTGNIVGAGAAILQGGRGAVFWMWVSAFFGMATAFSEGVFSQLTKKKTADGEITGGAAYYIYRAVGSRAGKYFASAFSLFSVIALGLTGVAVQSNSIAVSLNESFSFPFFVTGVLLVLAASAVLLRGTKAVARFSELTVPVLAGLYFAVCFAVLIKNFREIPEAFYLIFKGAFRPEALGGAFTGISLKTVIGQGVKRGLFTNEAGMGSTASSHAISDAPSPYFQGTLAVTGVFTDTFVMLTLTALCIITVLFTGDTPKAGINSGSFAVVSAFSSVLGMKGASVFTSLSVLFFAFASIIGWNLFGKSSAVFLFSERSTGLYTLSSLAFVFLGTVCPSSLLWELTDIFNTLMVLINAPALVILSIKTDKKHFFLAKEADK